MYKRQVYRVSNIKTIYLYLGGHADLNSSLNIIYQNIYNGGAYGVNNIDSPGGGATDFREVSGNWSDYNSLKSRIVTAGAGGGGRIEDKIYNGGRGGGLNGESGQGQICPSQYGMQDRCSASTCADGIHYASGTFGRGGLGGFGGPGAGWFGGGAVEKGAGGGGSGHTQNVINYGSFKVKNELSLIHI